VTLKAKSGYTFTGVTANSFTHYSGAAGIVNAAGSGTVTITFSAIQNLLYVGAGSATAGTETLEKALAWLKTNAANSTSYTIKLNANESLAPYTLSSGNLNSKTTGVEITLTTEDTTPRTVQLSQVGSPKAFR
jgi:hypothetical protein